MWILRIPFEWHVHISDLQSLFIRFRNKVRNVCVCLCVCLFKQNRVGKAIASSARWVWDVHHGGLRYTLHCQLHIQYYYKSHKSFRTLRKEELDRNCWLCNIESCQFWGNFLLVWRWKIDFTSYFAIESFHYILLHSTNISISIVSAINMQDKVEKRSKNVINNKPSDEAKQKQKKNTRQKKSRMKWWRHIVIQIICTGMILRCCTTADNRAMLFTANMWIYHFLSGIFFSGIASFHNSLG